ncbi:MAG: choice-of-anchor B family protein, partial [Actinomycetota bacterium]
MTRRTSTAMLALVALLSIAAINPLQYIDAWTAEARAHGHKLAYAASAEIPTETVSDIPCVNGMAGEFACDGIDLVSFMPSSAFGGAVGDAIASADVVGLISGNSDVWGWTDPETGDEIAIIGHTQGTAFIRVTDPANPVYLGSVPNTAAVQLVWHDIKVIDNYALIVSESNPHGIQVFDMTLLRDIPDAIVAPSSLPLTGFYPLSNAQHNIVVNEEAKMAYIVGGNTGIVVGDECSSGLNMVDFSNPLLPLPAGCYAGDAYIHDAQCLTYPETGAPDSDEHGGKHICANFAEDIISIVDVTDPANPVKLSDAEYDDAYTHQGWFTEDFRYILANDELDEQELARVTHTRTLLVDTADLDNIRVVTEFQRDGSDGNPATVSIDHNLYTHEGLVYQSNYESGL